MQKLKTRKISIFSSLDVKLEFLTSRVELTRFLVESSHVKLKICSIRLESSWKCEQLNFESSWIQNVNSKLNLMISLHLIVFYSKNMSFAKCNYKIYDKELLIIIWAFEHWWLELKLTDISIKMFIDHQALILLMNVTNVSELIRTSQWSSRDLI